jgi:photosystem II stability/assembly factor-like uncharacterized protein
LRLPQLNRRTEVNSRCAIFHGMLAICGYLAPESNAQWVQARDLPGGRIHDYCSIDSNYFLAMDGRIFRSDNDGASWTPMPSPGKNLEVYSVEEVDETILAGTPVGVYESSINNVSWKFFDRPGLSNAPALSIWTYLGYLYIGSEGAVYKSIDQGKTWAELNSGLPQDARITSFAGIVKIAVAGSENRGVFITESMNWIPPPDFDSANNQIRDLDVFGNKVYAVTTHEVLESTNLGADWGPSSFTLPNITCLLGDYDNLFAGTDQGINYSTDKGKTWKGFNEGIPENTAIQSLVELSGNIFASTDLGVWRITSPTAGIPSLPSEAPLTPPRLLGRQGSRSLLGITLPNADPVSIELVDFLGRRFGPGIICEGRKVGAPFP